MKTNGASEGEKARGTSTKEAKFRAHLQVAHLAVTSAAFSFLYLKKSKFQKYMFVLKNFKNIPRSPYEGGDRGPVAQATGDRTLT